MTSECVLVSYAASPTLLTSDHWRQIRTALLLQLPLRNIHWKSPSRPSIKTIQELDVNLVELDSLHDEHTSQVPTTLLEKPLLNIYIVTCEDTDFESYKSTIKKQIKDWHSVVTSRRHQEWIILHVVRPDARTPTGNFFQMKYSVFERIKTDFNAERRDRCVQLSWSNLYDNPAAWADLINKMKDGLLMAFDSAVSQREEEVRRSESQRQMPGWNFCTFFILKESLASSFEGLNLCEDAFAQYGELDNSFQQVLKEKNSSWFGTLIQPGPKDDSLPLLSTDKKPYRDLILANTISVFDLRSYMLARQCALLWKLGRINEVGKKVVSFLSTFGRNIREVKGTLPRFFVESWIYSSCLSVVEQCDFWTKDQKLEGPNLAAYNASKGELLELALNQLHVIGVAAGHLPSEPPFAAENHSPTNTTSSSDTSNTFISNTELLSAINNREQFDKRYVDITNRAIDMYAKAGRRKFALKLHGYLAAIDLYRGRLDAARSTFTSLPSHYAPHMWTSLEAYMLCRALQAHTQGSTSNTREWVSLVLSFLKLCVDKSGTALVAYKGDACDQISDFMKTLGEAASHLDPELIYPDHPGIQIEVASDARLVGSKDGAFLDVTIHNKLPCSMPISEIVAVITGRDGDSYRFTTQASCIQPGKTTLELFSPSASAGTYLLDFTELRLSGLILQWLNKKATKSPKALVHDQSNLVPVRIPLDHLALNVHLAQPKYVRLGELPKAQITLSSGRNEIQQVTLKLGGLGGVTLHCRETTVPPSAFAPRLQISGDRVVATGIPRDSVVEFLVPYSTTASDSIRVVIGADYVTTSEPTVTRTLQVTRALVTSLPLVINVEDFFREARLFSKFTISATTIQSIRVHSVDLKVSKADSDMASIVKASSSSSEIVVSEEAFLVVVTTSRISKTITPNQPASYLFHLDSNSGPVPETLELIIKYRLLREEVESLVDQAIDTVVVDYHSLDITEPHRPIIKCQLIESLGHNSSWVERYCITGQLLVPSREHGDLSEAYYRVVELLSSHPFELPSLDNWRILTIPVDVPNKNIVAAVELSLTSPGSNKPHNPPPVYAGQPISAFMTIKTSLHWSSDDAVPSNYALHYDIAEMVHDWLLSGQKRGEFRPEHRSSFTVPITLIALHHGELELPKVSIQVLPLSAGGPQGTMPSMDVHQVHGAERVLVLPRSGRSTFVVEMGSS